MVRYLAGDWPGAVESLNAALEVKANDGPSTALMDVMARSDFNAPEDWAGFRELTEK